MEENLVYSFCKQYKGKIYFRCRSGKDSINSIIKDFKPILYTESKETTGKVSYLDYPIKEKQFESIWEARQWANSVKDTPIKIHGNSDFAQQFLISIYEGKDVIGSIVNLRVATFDIETDWNGEETTAEEAKDTITAITIHDSFTDTYYVAGLCDYDNKLDKTNDCKIVYSKFDEEEGLIDWYITHFEKFQYDITVGFNSRKYDVPYIINRADKLLGELQTKRMSPFGIITTKEVVDTTFYNKTTFIDYEIFGTTHLDYLEVYKKHASTNLDNYKLDNIAEHELGQNKLSYEEEGSLFNLYRENPQKFIEYNIKDVKLLVDIEAKRKLLAVVVFMSFIAKTNFENALGTTKLWEDLLANDLYTTEIAPLFKQEYKSSGKFLAGGYVREPVKGKHKWGVTVDANSLN